MQQSISIVPTIFLASLAAFIGTVFWLYGFQKKRAFQPTQFLKVFLLIGYLVCLYILLFHTFGFLSKSVTGVPEMAINVTLFQSIRIYVSQGDFLAIFLGVFLTIPLFPLVYTNCYLKYPLRKIAAVTLCFVVLFEPIQLLGNVLSSSGRKVIDVDDLLLNLCGYFIGMMLTKLFMRERQSINTKLSLD